MTGICTQSTRGCAQICENQECLTHRHTKNATINVIMRIPPPHTILHTLVARQNITLFSGSSLSFIKVQTGNHCGKHYETQIKTRQAECQKIAAYINQDLENPK